MGGLAKGYIILNGMAFYMSVLVGGLPLDFLKIVGTTSADSALASPQIPADSSARSARGWDFEAAFGQERMLVAVMMPGLPGRFSG